MQEHIYALVDPDTRSVCYVGRTSKALRRQLTQHIATAQRKPDTDMLAAWIRNTGYRPGIVLLETVAVRELSTGENTASAAEIKWMKRFEKVGLANAWIDRDSRAYKRLTNSL